MEVIRPFTIDDTSLTSANVREAAPTAWDSGTTYALDDVVSVFTGTAAAVYQSLQASNTNHDPVTETAWWEYIGATYKSYSASTLYLEGDVVISTTTHHEYESLSGVSAGTVTITIATPGVVTLAGHGLSADSPVLLTSTGALPTGLSVNTIYYVRNATTDTFELAATAGGASIDTTGSQSGVHTLITDPNKGYALTDGAHWLDRGANNRWRMFDQSNTSKTTNPERISAFVQVTGRANSVALLNIVAATVRVYAQTVSEGIIYDQTFDLVSNSGVNNWYDYFFEPIIRTGDIVINDIPLYADPEVRVIIDEPGGTAEVGTMIVGQSLIIGGTVYGATVGIQDYSRKVADEFGNYSIVERAFAKRATFKVAVASQKVDAVVAFLSTVRATPAVYRGTQDYTSTFIYGFYKDFRQGINYPSLGYLDIDIEGLT